MTGLEDVVELWPLRGWTGQRVRGEDYGESVQPSGHAALRHPSTCPGRKVPYKWERHDQWYKVHGSIAMEHRVLQDLGIEITEGLSTEVRVFELGPALAGNLNELQERDLPSEHGRTRLQLRKRIPSLAGAQREC